LFASKSNIKYGDIELPADEWGLKEDIATGLEQAEADGVLFLKVPSKMGLSVKVGEEIMEKYLVSSSLRLGS
jgi:hypothetical protein